MSGLALAEQDRPAPARHRADRSSAITRLAACARTTANSSTMRLDVAGLALDRLRSACRTVSRSSRDLLAVLAAQALGRKLYRRQRVLDLVRDAARDVRPGARALRRDELGDVVEGDDRADVALACACSSRDRDGEGALSSPTLQRDFDAAPLALRPAPSRVRSTGANSGTHLGQRLADELILARCRAASARTADSSVMRPLRVEADDAGRHARQHRFDEVAALGQLGVGGDERVRWLFSSRVMG